MNRKPLVTALELSIALTVIATGVAPAFALDGSSITCEVSKPQIFIGESITVTGAINPPHAGVEVILKYTNPEGTPFIRTATSTGNGNYNDTTTPSSDGLWSVQASWSGDTDNQGNVSAQVKFLTSTINEATIKIGENQTFSCLFKSPIDYYYNPVSLESIVYNQSVTTPLTINFSALEQSFYYEKPPFSLGGNITSFNFTYNIGVLSGTPEGTYNVTAYYNIYKQTGILTKVTTLLFKYELRSRVTASLTIPEFPSFLILPMLMMVTLIMMVIYRRKDLQSVSICPS